MSQFHIQQNIATITFTRDEKRNAFDASMADDVSQRIDKARSQNARAILLRARPDTPVWSAGHDLNELREGHDPCDPASPFFQLLEKIKQVPLPVIAVLEGDAYAGGVLLLMAADLVVATDQVRLVMTGNRIGLPFPTPMYTYWLRVFGLHRMKEFFFTAKPMSAQEAHTAGIINRVCRPEDLERSLSEILEGILANSPEGIANTKRQLNAIANTSALSNQEQEAINAARREIYEGETYAKRLAAYRNSLFGR